MILSDENLWRAIYDLYCLLKDRVNDEDAYQVFFECHPVVFSVLGLDDARSFEKRSTYSLPFDDDRNFRPEPDFVGVDRAAGRIVIVELKTPFVDEITTSRSDGNRAKFKASAESYISQATEYAESIRQRVEARDVIKRALNIERISDYPIVLVYGTGSDNDARLVSELAAQRKIPTEIVFYDTLFENMVDKYAFHRRDNLSRPGWSFVFHLALDSKQTHRRSFLGEYGADTEDRVSVFLEDSSLVFECLDEEKRTHRLQSSINGPGPHYVRFEFSNDEDGIYMSLNVNNTEQDLRVGKRTLRLTPDTTIFTLGADSNGQHGARFVMLEHYAVGRTMGLLEKLESFYYFERKTQGPLHGLEFKPESFMVRLPSGDLVQGKEDLKPVLREWVPA